MLGCLMCGMNPVRLREKLQVCEIPSSVELPCWGRGLGQDSASPTCLGVVFSSFDVKQLLAGFQAFSGGGCCIGSCGFRVSIVPAGGEEFRMFLRGRPGPPLFPLTFDLPVSLHRGEFLEDSIQLNHVYYLFQWMYLDHLHFI